MTSSERMDRDTYSAVAYDGEGNVTGRIDGALSGNIVEFAHAHMEGSPFTPDELADKIEIERGGGDE